ncbi:MAG: DUF1217 domain-containing protein [Amaricoccus sp.]
MSYQPTIPMGGVAGWRFLERTQATQQATFDKSADVQRDVAYFEEKIGSITSAADLVADRRLLKVALGAFGLDGEIAKKAFIRKVLEEGTTDPKALASRLTDKSFARLSEAFGFGDASGPYTAAAGFAAKITDAYRKRAFEAAVGDADNNMRLALNFKREIADLATRGENGASWYNVLGSKPLRQVFEKAFGLPTAFAQVDIDRQRDVLADKTGALLGGDTLAVFKDPAAVEKVITRFLARAQIDEGASARSPASAVLTLLQGGGGGSQGILNLLASKG